MSLLSNLFDTKHAKKNSAVQLGYTTELHNHLVPGVDDGVKTLEESIEVIKKMADLGITKIITTPHIMSDLYKNTPEIITKGVENINNALAENNVQVQVIAGAEYYADEFFVKMVKDQAPLLTFGDQYLLFETSFINQAPYFYELVFELKSRGIKPILAHPERYRYAHHHFEILQKMYESGVYFQMNILSLAGYYSKEAEANAKKLLQYDMVDFVGTDTHHATQMNGIPMAILHSSYAKLLSRNRLLNGLL